MLPILRVRCVKRPFSRRESVYTYKIYRKKLIRVRLKKVLWDPSDVNSMIGHKRKCWYNAGSCKCRLHNITSLISNSESNKR